MLVAAIVACVVAQVALLRTVGRTASQPSHPDARPATLLEFAWSVLPVVALAWILVTAWQHHRDRATAPTAPAATALTSGGRVR